MLEEEVPLPFSETGVEDVVVVREGVALMVTNTNKKTKIMIITYSFISWFRVNVYIAIIKYINI